VCQRASVRLPRLPDSAGTARAFVTRTLMPCVAETSRDIVDATQVSVSELVTNAVRYGDGDITVELVVHRDALDLTVTDRGAGRPQPRHAGAGAESGRGLILVDAVSSEWGTRPLPEGKAVWCRLALAPAVTCVTCDADQAPRAAVGSG
jgi:anti-sigma regulatory factor (Ser/Thr protein kinase)